MSNVLGRVCAREREASSCQRRSSTCLFPNANPEKHREKTEMRRSPLHLCSGSTPSSSMPLSENPDSLLSLLFSGSFFNLQVSLFSNQFFSYLCPGSRGSTLRRLVTGGHKFVSRSQERGDRVCVCVCIEGGGPNSV